MGQLPAPCREKQRYGEVAGSTRAQVFLAMEGYLGKKGKRMGSRVKRYMRLDGALLSNHHDPGKPPTWRVNVREATISTNSKRHRISIELFNNKLELYADSAAECGRWYEALCVAKSIAVAAKNEDKENKENNVADGNENVNMDSTTDGSIEHKESKVLEELGKNFKVVKPAAQARSSESSGSDEVYEGVQRLVVQGQTYEETPASMIFKQFNFPAK